MEVANDKTKSCRVYEIIVKYTTVCNAAYLMYMSTTDHGRERLGNQKVLLLFFFSIMADFDCVGV